MRRFAKGAMNTGSARRAMRQADQVCGCERLRRERWPLGMCLGLLRGIAGAVLLCAAVVWMPPAHAQGTPSRNDLAVLYGLRFEGSQIAIDVVSSGCTDASYFSVRLEPAPDASRLSIVALRQDRCRMRQHIVTLTLDLPAGTDPAGTRFLLQNTLAAPTTLPRAAP